MFFIDWQRRLASKQPGFHDRQRNMKPLKEGTRTRRLSQQPVRIPDDPPLNRRQMLRKLCG